MAKLSTQKKNKPEPSIEDEYLETEQGGGAADSSTGTRRVEAEWGTMAIAISSDAMEAKLVELVPNQGGKPLDIDMVLAGLSELKILHEVKVEQIMEAVEIAGRKGCWKGDRLISAGTFNTAREKVTYLFLKEFGENVNTDRAEWRLGEEPLSFVSLQALSNAKTTAEVAQLQGKVKAVGSGEILATVEVVPQGSPGRDVFDQPVELPPKNGLTAGDHVVITRQGVQFETSDYGYVLVLQNCISVMPPIWISPDRMEAYYVSLPQIGTAVYPGKDDVEALIERQEIKVGIQSDTIEALCDKLANGKKVPVLTLVAQGQPPQPGENARLAYTLDVEEKPGKVQEDGSIDLRERNLTHDVSADELLAEKIEATKGVAGQTLFAEPIETTDGEDLSVEVGAGVRLSEEGGIKLYAEIDGVTQFLNGKLSITELFVLRGDVDYESGNIDVNAAVQISGAVRSGFTVKAGGNVTIGDSVENGATINAQGDVTISKGIIGDNVRIISLGDIRAQFIQNANIIAKGNIWVGSYIMNATVRAGGWVMVEKKGGDKGGRVTGGSVSAAQGIELHIAGSESNPRTMLVLQADPKTKAELDKLERTVKLCDENITKIMRTMGLKKFDPGAIKLMMARVPPAKREIYVKILEQLSQLMKKWRSNSSEADQLNKKVEKELRQVEIQVRQAVFPRVEVQIGTRKFPVSEDLGPTVFCLKDNKVVIKK